MSENKNLPNLDFSGFSTEKYMNKKFKDAGNAPYETPAYGTGVDPSKYREYLGQGFDVYAPDIERKRAESQSVGEQIGAFANQAVVGEVIGGTVMSLGAIAEIPQLLIDGLTDSESRFTNAIYEAGDNLSKWTRDVTPIYQTGDRFSDTGWWFQNGVSVVSAASMLLPGAGVAKGVGKLGQLMKWSKIATDMTATGLGSLAMRHAENFREANGVFQSIYNEAISKGLDEETARKNASDAAALDYGANYVNLAFDMIQLGALMKPLSSWTRNKGGLGYDLSKALGVLPESKLGRALYWSKDKLLPQVSEGVEEVVNTISQKESERYGKILNDPKTKDDTTFTQRLGNYLGDPDVVDSFIWGVAGGVAFKGIGKLLGLDQSNSVVQNKLKEVSKRQETLGRYLSNMSAASNRETITDSEGNIVEDFRDSSKEEVDRYIKQQWKHAAFDLGMSASRAGNMDLLLEWIESPEFKQNMIQSGVADETVNTIINELKNDLLLTEKLYKQSFGRFYNLNVSPEVKNYLTDKATALEYGRAKVAEMRDDMSKEYTTAYSNDEYLKAYGANPAVQNTIDMISHQYAIESLTQELATAKEADKEDIENTIEKLSTKLADIQANRFGTVDSNLINPLVYETKARQLVFNSQFDNLSEDIAKEQSPENIKKTEKKVETIKKNINSNIANNEVTKKNVDKATRVKANKTIIEDTDKFTLKPEDIPTQEELDTLEDEGEVIDTLGEETIATDELVDTPTTPRLEEYNTRKAELDVQRDTILNEYNKYEMDSGVSLIKERAELEESYKANLQQLNKEFVDTIPQGEKDEIKVSDVVTATSNIQEGYSDNSDRVVNGNIDSIDSTFLDDDLIKKLTNSYNAVARLDREYGIKNGKYVEVSNELNPKMYKPVLNPDKYGVGTKVTLRVADRNDIEVTDPTTGLITTWGDLKKTANYNESVPIELVDADGNVLGFYHDINWVSNPDKVAYPEADVEIAKKVRDYVVEKGEVETTITENRFGVLNRTMDNKKYPVKDIVEDPNVAIMVAEDSVTLSGIEGYNLVNNFTSSPLNAGYNYMVVKVGKKLGNDAYIALPLSNMTYEELSKVDNGLFHNIHHSIEAAVNVYIKNGKDLSTTEQSLFNRCKDLINVDLTSPEGILKYLEGFLYNDKRDFGERSQFKFDDGNLVFRRKKPIKGQATQFFVGKNVKDRDKSLQIFSDNIESMLKDQYFNTSRVFTSDNTNIPIVNSSNEVEAIPYMDVVKTATKTNIMGKEVDTNSDGTKAYSYTVQKVIRFDTSFVEPKPTGTDDTTTETINDIIESSDIEYEELEPMEFNFVDDGLSFAVAEDEIGKLDKSLEGILVKDLGFAKQEDIVSYISEKMLSKLYTDGTTNVKATTDEIKDTFTKNNATVDFNIKKIKSNILKATQSKKTEDVTKFKEQLANLERFKKLVESVVGNWNTLVGISLNKVNRLNGTKFIDNQDDDTVFENDLFEIEGDENANWAVSDLTTDRKKSLSRDVKLFCSGIVDLNSEGKPNKTWIGTSRLVPFDIVYNTVQALTSNLPPNLDAIKNELSKSTDAFPWLNDFISKLDNANSRTKKSIVKALTNYYANTTSYKYSTDSRGNYFVRAFDSDASAMGKVILNTWESNFMKSGLVGYADGTTINEDAANKWLERYRELNKTKGINVTIEDVDSLLKEVGIVLSPQALNDIKTNGITVTKSKNISLRNIMSNGFSPIVVIRNFLELNKGKDLSTKLTTETAIERIAKIQNKFETKLHSNSQKSGGRTIYSYGKPKFFVNRFRRFKDYVEGNDVTMGKVLESPFVTNLLWATNLKNSTTRDSFMANFDYEIADLEPISELGKKSRKNRELNNVSPAEVELYRLFGLMAKRPDKSGNKNRVISLMHPTTSDKTTVHNIVTIAAPFSYNTDGTLDDKSYKLLYDNLILPEITRIRHFEALKAKGVDITKFEGWADGWNKFLVIPEMNSYPEVFIGESLNPNLENEYENIITNVLKPHVESLVSEKKILWDEYEIGLNVTNDKGKIIESNKYLDKQYLSSLEARFAKNPRVAAMYDMVGQYLIGNANTWGLFNTDPAQYFDKKALAAWNKGNKDLAVQKVYENMGKRLAADVAPGEESVANDGGTITYAFIKDPKVTSLRFEQLKEQFGDSIASSYEGMDGTDAQEFVTLQEHLFNMDADGLLPDGMYDVIANTIQQELSKVDIAGNPTPNHYYTEAIVKNLNAINPQLGEEYEKIVLQVKKPVYVENVFDDDLGVERRIYVKSSAYPLTPELCAKIQMDDIRIAMEKQGIQRLAFATATKVGNYKKNVELFDSEGNVVPNIDFSTTKMVVPRSGLRDQMPVPYDEMKKEIKKVSQASKNLFVNIKEVPGMAALEQEYLNIYHEIFKEQYDKLINDIVVDGNLNVPKLKDILIEEATGRGYPLSDIQMLELDTNLRLLPFSPNAAKYESLLNSIVENRVDKIMLPGKSFVLSTEMGYKAKPTAKLVGNAKNIERLKNRGLVTTRNFTGELLPQRLEDGVVKPAQVIMPFKFRDNQGNLLHVEDFMDSDVFIDTSKLPESVLKLFGMRIPNQGPNSQSAIEIVGFMPHNAGDVIVATKDYLAQMGSDFDVDKLYAYMYETEYKNGRIIKKDSLKNKIVDIHLQIHANPDPRVQRQIAKPIGEWKLKAIADEVTKLKSKGKELFSPASDGYQKMKFLNATAGKSGVGTYSVASMFVANMQGKGMIYTTLDKDDNKVPIQLAIGNTVWNGDISNIYTLRSQKLIENAGGYDNLTEEEKKQITYKSEVVEGHQSVAVDNEKLQLMDKTNDNAFTFNYTIAAMSAGFEDELVWLRSQPIIFDYVKELQYLKSPLSGFFGDAEVEASNKILSKYGVKIDPETLNADSTTYLTIDNMKKCIEGTSESFTVTQGVALGMFQLLHEVGMKIQSVTSATNTDSKGIGINMFVNYAKQQAVQNLINSPIKNAEKLLGIFNEEGILVEPTTIAGFATKYGLETANNLWSGLFPYQNMTVQEMFNTIEGLTKSEEAGFTSKANTQQEVWTDFKSYLFSRDDLGIIDSTVDINAERDRLFIDRKDKKGNVLKKSFISKMAEIAELPEMKRRPFINRLNFTIEYDTNKASRVSFNAASAENLEESQIYQDIIDLLVNDRPIPNSDITTRAMMEDLIKTQYLGGGIQEAIQFIKYIPAQYYYLIPFADRLSNVWSELNDSNNRWLNFKSDSLPNFIEQWIQHNPNKVTDVKPELVKSIKDGKFAILDKNLLTKQSDNTMTSEPYVKRYNKDAKGNKTELFKFINIFDENGNPVYQQIPLLGTFGMSEYNANIPQGMLQTSLLSPIGVTKVESGSNVDNSNTTDEAITNPLSTTNQVLTQAVNLGISNKPVNINDVLVKMSATTSNPYLQLLSEELIKIKNNSTIRIDSSINTFGKYLNNEISINTNLIKTLPKLGEVIIHESLHSIGDTQINQFLQDKSKLNPQVREAITSLETLRNKLLQSVKDTPKYKEYLAKKSKVGTNERVSFTPEEVTQFESTSSLKEFFIYAMSNENTQKWLNSIEYKANQTALDRFKEILNKMYHALIGRGITINPNSALSTAIKNSIVILNAQELYESDVTVSKPSFSTTKTKPNVEISSTEYTRESVSKDKNSMYLFTDNNERTSRPYAVKENVSSDSWYYKKYKSKTNKPIHYGSISNPTSAVIRGLNNAYPISTMSAFGTNWNNSNLTLFKQVITEEINQIKQDLPNFNKLIIGNYRIGQGGKFAKLPLEHQNFLDDKLKEIGIDNTENTPKILNISIPESRPTVNTDLFTLKPEDFTEGDIIESLAVKEQTKKGVDDIFQEFPELANSVYEVLGFNFRYTSEKWKDDPTKENKATYINIKGTPSNQEFQIKKDIEDGFYSVHFKTEQGKLTKEQIQTLIDAVASQIPIGGKLSTWGEITKGGISGLNRFLNNGFKKVGERKIKDKEGSTIVIPILEKVEKSNLEQQAQQLYSRYLDAIFPDSKVRDIVYHGTTSENKFDVFNSELNNFGGFYFTKNKKVAQEYGVKGIISAILNVQNPLNIVDITSDMPNHTKVTYEPFKDNNYDYIDYRTDFEEDRTYQESVVKSSEQIHILLSKKDLEMFRNFINFTKSEYAKYGDIQQFRDYIMSKNFAAIEEFLVVNNKIDRKC